LRAVPFDQLKAGTYCTNSFEKESKLAIHEQIAPIITAPLPNTFGNEITCVPIPENTPAFKDVLEEYGRLVEEAQIKLPGAVGLLTITDDQSVDGSDTNNKRIDIKIIWTVPEVDEKKTILLNTDGTPKLKMVTMEVPDLEADGTQKLSPKGLPLMKTVTVPAVTSSGKTVFVNKASEYFNYGG